jgi:cytochrome b561
MPLKDTKTGYGWMSIALHWITAIVIVVLLFIGNSIATLAGDARAEALRLHTSIAIVAYVVLWGRIVWRLVYGHPGPLSGQRGVFFFLGKLTHYAILIALALMLVSGPLMAWAGYGSIGVFDWVDIPSPFAGSAEFRDLMHAIHRRSAIVIFIGTLLHLGGVYKHTAFNHDGTLAKIIFPAKPARARDSGADTAVG